METDEKGIYAIGDMTGAPWLAHKASHEIIASEHIASANSSHNSEMNKHLSLVVILPPQIASIEMTEQQAKDAGYNLRLVVSFYS